MLCAERPYRELARELRDSVDVERLHGVVDAVSVFTATVEHVVGRDVHERRVERGGSPRDGRDGLGVHEPGELWLGLGLVDGRVGCGNDHSLRPRRFDRIIKIEAPSAAIRETYFRRKLPDLTNNGQLTRWVDLTEGLSFAALAELVISVACLGNNLEETVTLLRGLDDQQPNSREFERPGQMGFGTARGHARRRDEEIPF